MDRLDSMAMFVRVVETGSFSAVAKELNTTQPTVSKHVAELESWLGAKLLNRSTRSLHLTEVGADYYERCISILQDIEDAEQSVGMLQTSPKGTVKINTLVAFGRLHIIPKLADFFQQYPDINIEISLNDRIVDLVQEGIDVAIRMGELDDSALVAKKINECPWMVAASQEYLATEGFPEHPRDLKQHQCLIYSGVANANQWQLYENGEPIILQVKGKFKTSDSEGYRSALKAGLGIGLVPYWLVNDLIDSEQVVPILNDYWGSSNPIYAVYPPGRHVPSKVRTFVDYLTEQFQGADCIV